MDVLHRPPSNAERLRVELFSDAVFAVAITLLVLDLPLTHTNAPLLDALGERWPAFAAFGISFTITGCLWVSHFRLFRLVDRVDGPLLFLNLALLLWIVLVPFGASTLATFVSGPAAQSRPAAALFAGIIVAMGSTFRALYALVQRRASGEGPAAAKPTTRLAAARDMAAFIVNSCAIGVAFVSPIAVLAMVGAVSLYYIVDQLLEPAPALSAR